MLARASSMHRSAYRGAHECLRVIGLERAESRRVSLSSGLCLVQWPGRAIPYHNISKLNFATFQSCTLANLYFFNLAFLQTCSLPTMHTYKPLFLTTQTQSAKIQ